MVCSFFHRAYRFVVATARNLFMEEHLLHRLSPQFKITRSEPTKSLMLPPDGALALLINSDVDDLFVRDIVWCKRGTGVKHEFLIVYVQEACNPGLKPRTAAILVERNAEPVVKQRAPVQDGPNANADDGGHDVTPPADTSVRPARAASNTRPPPGRPQRPPLSFSLDSANSSSSDLFSSSSRSKDSGDVLVFACNPDDKFVEPREEPYTRAKKLTIEKGKFSLFQFLILVNIVHEEHPNYDVEVYNCFWFARSLYKTVRELVPEATHTKIVSGLGLGKYKLITTGKGRWTPEQFATKFNEDWPNYKKQQDESRALAKKPLEDERALRKVAEQKAERAESELRELRGLMGSQASKLMPVAG